MTKQFLQRVKEGPRTLEGFLRALKKSGKRWRLWCGFAIRTTELTTTITRCPLDVVYGRDRGTPLRYKIEDKVRTAADHTPLQLRGRQLALRRRLLRACGLKEEK